MRICDRCKDPKKMIQTRLNDVRTGTEYDLCPECSEAFNSLFSNIEEAKPKKAKRGD